MYPRLKSWAFPRNGVSAHTSSVVMGGLHPAVHRPGTVLCPAGYSRRGLSPPRYGGMEAHSPTRRRWFTPLQLSVTSNADVSRAVNPPRRDGGIGPDSRHVAGTVCPGPHYGRPVLTDTFGPSALP